MDYAYLFDIGNDTKFKLLRFQDSSTNPFFVYSQLDQQSQLASYWKASCSLSKSCSPVSSLTGASGSFLDTF